MSASNPSKIETLVAKLQELLPRFDNANAAEAEAARQAIKSVLATVGLDEPSPSVKLFAKDADLLVQLGLASAKLYHSSRSVPYATS